MNINEKMVYTAINEHIEELCASKPKRMPQEVFNSSDTMSDQFEYIEKFHRKNLLRLTPALRRQIKSMFTYAVVHDGVYNERLAKRWNVKIPDIQDTYNMYWNYRSYLTRQDEYSTFLEYLYVEAKDIYRKEKEACEKFERLSSLEQETHPCPPRFWLRKQMGKANKRIKELQRSLKSLKKPPLVIGMPIDRELQEERSTIRTCINNEKQNLRELGERYKNNRPKGERKNYFYMERFRFNDLEIAEDKAPEYILMGSVSIVKEMLQEFCSWFNRVHADEIKAHNLEVRKDKQRLAYAERNREKLQLKKEKQKTLQSQVHQQMQKGVSLRKIAAKLRVSYGSVRRASKQIEQLILEQ